MYGFSNAETDGWDSPATWGFLGAAGVLLVAFVLWQRGASHPLLPLTILQDRNRSGAYVSVLIAGVGMFGLFLFVTYHVECQPLGSASCRLTATVPGAPR